MVIFSLNKNPTFQGERTVILHKKNETSVGGEPYYLNLGHVLNDLY